MILQRKKYYAYACVKFPVTDTHVFISPVMLLFLRKTGIHYLWLSNLTTASKVLNPVHITNMDKSRLSCLVCVGGVIRNRDRTKQLQNSATEDFQKIVSNSLHIARRCELGIRDHQFTLPTRQDSLVLSAVWIRHYRSTVSNTPAPPCLQLTELAVRLIISATPVKQQGKCRTAAIHVIVVVYCVNVLL